MIDVTLNKNELIEILKNCYRKYKSMVYFQNVLSFRKKQIAIFENDKISFEKTFVNLCLQQEICFVSILNVTRQTMDRHPLRRTDLRSCRLALTKVIKRNICKL